MEFLGQEIKRTRRERGISLTVRDGEIVVAAGPLVTDDQVLEFLNRHRRFIQNRIGKHEERQEKYAELYDFSHVMVAGTSVPLVLGLKSGIENGTVYARDRKEVPLVLKRNYEESFRNRVKRYADYMGITFAEIRFGGGKSRWGTCNARGNLFFSWTLFMIPLPLVDYVIVHELCHRRQMNHSVLFWKEVERYLPDYLMRRKELQKYNFLTQLYM